MTTVYILLGSLKSSQEAYGITERPGVIMALVDNSQIQGAELLKPLPLYLHTYVAPFAIIWPIFARYFYTPELYAKHIGSSEWTFVWCGAIITLQSLVWLSTNWSVNLKALFTARKASRIEDAQLIKVIPIANAGSADICKLIRDKVYAFSLHTSPFDLANRLARSRSATRQICLFYFRSAVFSMTLRRNPSVP